MNDCTALNLPVPSSLGTLEQYISYVNQLPLLSADEEQQLAIRCQNNQDVDAAKSLVLSHLRLVVSIARGYLGYGLPHADLIQEGNIGLMKAVKRFDPSRGVRLVSFAIHWIKAEIHEFIIRNWRMVKIATTKAQRKLFFNLRSLRQNSNSLNKAEIQDIAKTLAVKPEEVCEMETRLNGRDVPMDKDNADNDEDAHYAPISYLPDPHAAPEQQLMDKERQQLATSHLQLALAQLDSRSQSIIARRWLADKEQAPTLHQLADEYGVSAERIRQIEARALQKLKSALQQHQ